MTKKMTLTKENVRKILTGGMIALTGALVTYFAEALQGVDFGEWTPVVTAISAILVNAIREYLKDK